MSLFLVRKSRRSVKFGKTDLRAVVLTASSEAEAKDLAAVYWNQTRQQQLDLAAVELTEEILGKGPLRVYGPSSIGEERLPTAL